MNQRHDPRVDPLPPELRRRLEHASRDVPPIPASHRLPQSHAAAARPERRA